MLNTKHSEGFVNKYIVHSFKKRLITSFKNEFGNAQILEIG